MKLNIDILTNIKACNEGKKWFIHSKCETVESTIYKLITEKKYQWANWLISYMLTINDKLLYMNFVSLGLEEKYSAVIISYINCIKSNSSSASLYCYYSVSYGMEHCKNYSDILVYGLNLIKCY